MSAEELARQFDDVAELARQRMAEFEQLTAERDRMQAALEEIEQTCLDSARGDEHRLLPFGYEILAKAREGLGK